MNIVLKSVFYLLCTIPLTTFAQYNDDIYELNTTHKKLIKLTYRDIGEFLDAHNKWRDDVKVPQLEWNDYLAKYAADWAIKIGEQGCELQHRPDSRFGENIYWTSAPDFIPKEVVDEWGSEKKQYKGKVIGDDISKTGHYTQLVWYETKEVGCAAFKCSDGIFVVCNYNPTGNIIDEHPYKRDK